MFLPTMRRCLIVMTALFPVAASADTDTLSNDFAVALEAARQNQWPLLERQEKRLGENFPLQGYLDFHRLRARLPRASIDDVLAYIRTYDDSPLAESMRRLAMEHYGQQRRWTDLQAVSAGVPSSMSQRCHYYQAMLGGERERALQAARGLWLSGQSRPTSCDPLFDALKQAGQLDDALVWQRLLLAADAGNETLMRYLRSELKGASWAARADTLLKLHRQPQQVRYLQPGEQHDAIAVAALEKLAQQQPEEARRLLPMLVKRLSLSEEQQQRIGSRIAWFSVIRDVPENRAWLDDFLASEGDQRVLEQRARRAVVEQDWASVERWVHRLPATERTSSRWRYWLARAHEARGDSEGANRYYRLAASGRSFWGFLAADHLGVPPALNNRPALSEEIALSERSERVIARVELLLAIGEGGHAREEWLYLLRHLDDASQQGFTGRAWWNLTDKVGCGRTLVRCTDAGGRGNQARFDGCNVADGRATMAVADQVDLGLAADGDDLFHLGQQLFAAGFRGIQLADFGDIHAGAVAAQCSRDAVPVVDAQDAVEAEHAVGQYNRVLGLGVAGGAEPESMGVARGQQAGAQAEGEQGFIVVHWCSR